MSTIEIITELMPTLAMPELLTVMKIGAELMAAGAKGGVAKAPRAKGVVNRGLAKNNEWVDIVLTHATTDGWEEFEAKDGDGIMVVEASVDTADGPRFTDGKEFNRKYAMSLSKHLRDSESELWIAFSAEYDEEHPVEEKPASAAAAPVRRTRAEISAAAEERKQRLEEERAAKAAVRAAEKKARDEAKAEEAAAKAALKEEKAAAAAAAKLEKEAAKNSKLPAASSAAATRVAALMAKVKTVPAEPAAAAAAASAAASAPAAAAPAKKTLSQSWKPPAAGAFKLFPFNGEIFIANNKYEVYAFDAAQGERGAWIGVYIPSENRINKEAAEPVDDEEDEDS